jgi:hypothetical protein
MPEVLPWLKLWERLFWSRMRYELAVRVVTLLASHTHSHSKLVCRFDRFSRCASVLTRTAPSD